MNFEQVNDIIWLYFFSAWCVLLLTSDHVQQPHKSKGKELLSYSIEIKF